VSDRFQGEARSPTRAVVLFVVYVIKSITAGRLCICQIHTYGKFTWVIRSSSGSFFCDEAPKVGELTCLSTQKVANRSRLWVLQGGSSPKVSASQYRASGPEGYFLGKRKGYGAKRMLTSARSYWGSADSVSYLAQLKPHLCIVSHCPTMSYINLRLLESSGS